MTVTIITPSGATYTGQTAEQVHSWLDAAIALMPPGQTFTITKENAT